MYSTKTALRESFYGMYADFSIITWLIEFKPFRAVGDPRLPCVKVLTKHTGAPWRLSRRGNLKRSERGRPRGGKSVV